MQTAKLFSNGRSQAVRLPKDCRFSVKTKEIYIHKMEGMVLLIPKKNSWESLIHSLDQFPKDFMEERKQPSHPEQRQSF